MRQRHVGAYFEAITFNVPPAPDRLQLGCDPMRITKKYTGTSCLGKRVYHSENLSAPREAIDRTKVRAALHCVALNTKRPFFYLFFLRVRITTSCRRNWRS